MRSAYSDVIAEDPRHARAAEGAAFDFVLAKLVAARAAACGSPAIDEALDGLERLWTLLLRDMGQPDNALPSALRGQLVSVAIWVMREIAGIRGAVSRDLDSLIAVNATIRAGLR